MPTDNFGKVEVTYNMLADRGKRFVNFLMDSIICYVLTFLVGILGNWLYDTYGFNGLAIGNIEVNAIKFNLLHSVLSVVFYGLFETVSLRTPGKYITGTKVVMFNGEKPTQTAIFWRTLCRLIPFEAITFLGAAPVGWHDGFSKTLVVDIYEYERALRKKNASKNVNNPGG
ncbi:RDD family protein [Flavobacterium sp. Sd200]|uniref:RDD family protein n=1 Tax=Flavobacterium sp. Sd200 TaxID=2692211 RepID=UPI001367B7E6|nr:RDD family protein [Flavobacterium sp. Sd200]MXN93067.1 RDD family protein [Flavobacterium sp. Sd200]